MWQQGYEMKYSKASTTNVRQKEEQLTDQWTNLKKRKKRELLICLMYKSLCLAEEEEEEEK